MHCEGIAIPVVGRVGTDPSLLKPSIWSLTEVLKKMGSNLSVTVFIGDTKRDYDTAINAGCSFIGMAPTKTKYQRLAEILSCSDIVTDYYELAERLGI